MIFGINGKLRNGKGILATKIALSVADNGGVVKANYHLESPNAEYIDFYDIVKMLEQGKQKKRTLLVIDEIYGWLESRISSSKVNRFASYFVFQSAKLGYDIIYTSQLTMRVDCSLRELCDYRVYAQKDAKKQYFKYYFLDTSKPNEDIPTGKIWRLSFKEAAKFWDRYNTFEGVKPLGMQELFVEMEKYAPERQNKTINRQVRILSSLIEKGKLPQDTRKIAVESALLDLGESTANAAIVSYRLGLPLQYRNRPLSAEVQPQAMESKHNIGYLSAYIAQRNKTFE